MTREELLQRITDHEDNYVERKSQGVSSEEVRATIVAFANTLPPGREAILVVGIHDKGHVEGCADPDKRQKDIRRAVESCYPPILVKMEVAVIGGLPVVAVIVPASESKPHFTGPAYVRVGSETVRASELAFNELVYSRTHPAAELLRLKGQTVILVGLGHRLGSARRDVGHDHREGGEARIEGCDAHTAHFTMLGSGVSVSEPLSHITISYNNEKHRREIVVRGY